VKVVEAPVQIFVLGVETVTTGVTLDPDCTTTGDEVAGQPDAETVNV
jgi:hypothetical protein